MFVSNNFIKQFIDENGTFTYNPINKKMSVTLSVGPEKLRSTFLFANENIDNLYKELIPLVKSKLETLQSI